MKIPLNSDQHLEEMVADTNLESRVPVRSVHSGGVPSDVSEVSRWIRSDTLYMASMNLGSVEGVYEGGNARMAR